MMRGAVTLAVIEKGVNYVARLRSALCPGSRNEDPACFHRHADRIDDRAIGPFRLRNGRITVNCPNQGAIFRRGRPVTEKPLLEDLSFLCSDLIMVFQVECGELSSPSEAPFLGFEPFNRHILWPNRLSGLIKRSKPDNTELRVVRPGHQKTGWV